MKHYHGGFKLNLFANDSKKHILAHSVTGSI